jgi:hypothetical protein
VLDFTAHYRANVQTAYGRWYVSPVNGKASGPGKLHQTSNRTLEKQFCESATWEPDTLANEPPVDKTCTRPIVAAVDFFTGKKGLRLGPGGFYHGKCEFGNVNDPLPLGFFDKLNVLYAKISKNRLRHSRAPVVATRSGSKTQTRTETGTGSVTTITDHYEASWTATFKRKGPWRVWR